MKIQGNTSHSAHAYGQIKQQQQAQAEQANTAKPSESLEAEASIQATSSDQQKIGGANGVIRHLQEGHYQGVAQLRLSIVHAERFQQAASQKTAEVLEAEGEQLTASLYTHLNNPEETGSSSEIMASLDVEGAMKAFEDAVDSGIDGSESGRLTVENFRDVYSDAFQALIEKLEPAYSQPDSDIEDLVQPAPDNNGEGDVAIDKLAEEGTLQPTQAVAEQVQEQAAVSVDVAALEEWFTGELDRSLETIQNQVVAISAPPLPSQPAGSGAAYEKFLAVYEELYGTVEQQPDATPQGETGSIETKA